MPRIKPAFRLARRLLAVLILLTTSSLLIIGCNGPITALYPPSGDSGVTIQVINHGYHSGLILPASEARHLLPELVELPEAAYLEIGWGDANFYQASGQSIPLAIKALFTDTNAVLHVVSINNWPRRYFPHADIIKLQLSRPGFESLMQQIKASFTNPERASPIGPGLYGQSRFYPAKGHYWLGHTCNHWSAETIRASGFPITPEYAATASNLMFQLRQGLEP